MNRTPLCGDPGSMIPTDFAEPLLLPLAKQLNILCFDGSRSLQTNIAPISILIALMTDNLRRTDQQLFKNLKLHSSVTKKFSFIIIFNRFEHDSDGQHSIGIVPCFCFSSSAASF